MKKLKLKTPDFYIIKDGKLLKIKKRSKTYKILKDYKDSLEKKKYQTNKNPEISNI